MTTKERVAVMQAWLDGKQIQVRTHGRWADIGPHGEPSWLSHGYRIKPKCHKVSISLFDADVNKIEDFMRHVAETRNMRIDRSTAIKLVIRMSSRRPEPGPLKAALVKLRSEDGRR